MFGKSQIKLIRSLAQKKFRQKHGLFTVEGKKAVSEILSSKIHLHSLYCTQDIFDAEKDKIFKVSEVELKKISSLSTPQTALAVFHIPDHVPPEDHGLKLALDEVRDPGNLGTIIRLCDWFGIRDLICSENTVDCYNPKVVQASMGSIGRVNIFYTELENFLSTRPAGTPICGTFLEGENIYSENLKPEGIIVLGNEANGISPEIEALITQRLTIPQFGVQRETESLNVATATAIVLSEFKRRSI